ncbi:complement factor D-like [Megalops cyprinoides]|uniref:complement factor D-like n=1 Tax=Megalops cyprinoides TaxID=118141 RepID=UPI0018656003|nr:complement factor D-like [Megalops cyprinoides]
MLTEAVPLLLWCLCLGSCGSERIIEGKEAEPHSRPYMATIQRRGEHDCGGFLVAEKWVMTAAHCTGEDTVVLGAHSLRNNESTKQVFTIEAFHRHPNASNTGHHDIALFKLKQPATLTSAVQTIAFQRSGEDVPAGSEVTTAGWGYTTNNIKPDTLQEVSLTVLSHQQCANRDHYRDKLTSDMMCASSCTGKRTRLLCKDACMGDSGGPLIYKDMAVGIVMGGGDCGKYDYPGVYTVISHYVDWIDSIMANE